MTNSELYGMGRIRLAAHVRVKKNCEGDEVMKELEAFFNVEWLVSNYRARAPQWMGTMTEILWTKNYIIVYYDGHDYFFGDEGSWEDKHPSRFPYATDMSGEMREIFHDTMKVLSL